MLGHPSARPLLVLCWTLAAVARLPAVEPATITIEQRTMPTYGFGDPSPLASAARIYPYHRFDGFSTMAEPRTWTLVRLDNPWLTVWVAPEIGGKVWGAVEKSSGRAFIYSNPVVKFRDVALRGPWTSGGIEFNVGIIGHAPTTATPVDWATRVLPDGTAECVVGALDLPSRSRWRVAIRLPAERAAFSTDGTWENPTTAHQACYQWTTAAAEARDDLRVIHPGQRYLGHGGDVHPWPVENGHELSRYADNRHQPDSSYHVIGQWAEYFGGWWDDLDFGYAHWSPTGDKPGQKVWLWSQARSGAIWRDLLTDAPAGQYIEMQSGLMHHQADPASMRTPFKHAALAPGATLAWQEQWFPLRGVAGGVVDVTPWGALNVVPTAGRLSVHLCPVQAFTSDLVVRVAGEVVSTQRLTAEVLQPQRFTIELGARQGVIEVTLAGHLAWRSDDAEQRRLDRPVTLPAAYDWDSAEGRFQAGEAHLRQREHGEAIASFTACLAKEPYHLRALARLSELRNRRGEYSEALGLARRALELDASDAEANLAYAVANEGAGRLADAIDGYGWAARSPALHGLANTRLAVLHARQGDWWRAALFAGRAAESCPAGSRLAAFIARRQGHGDQARALFDRLALADPLDHLVHAERWRLEPSAATQGALVSGIRNEMPEQTFLEVASWYLDLGADDDAIAVLRLAPAHPVVDLWLAWLQRFDAAASAAALQRVVTAPVRGVFPFRLETLRLLIWARQQAPHWKFDHYTGLLLASLGRGDEARAMLDGCGSTPDEAAFYLNRSRLRTGTGAITDLQRAEELDSREWRAPHLLALGQHEAGDDAAALATTTRGHGRFPVNQALILTHANALLANGRPQEALATLDGVTLLPFEGATDGRDVYRRAHLFQALVELKEGNAAQVDQHLIAAREWPEQLGAGRPIEVDERIEDFITALSTSRRGDMTTARAAYQRVVAASAKSGFNAVTLLAILAHRALGSAADGEALLARWAAAARADDPVLPWATAVLAGDRAGATALLANDAGRRLFNPWIRGRGDRSLALVARICDQLVP